MATVYRISEAAWQHKLELKRRLYAARQSGNQTEITRTLAQMKHEGSHRHERRFITGTVDRNPKARTRDELVD